MHPGIYFDKLTQYVPYSSDILAKNDEAYDPQIAAQILRMFRRIEWRREGRVAMLVETPEPHRHVVRESVDVIEGRGFSGDHSRKSFYRGKYVPGREVSAISLEVLNILDVEPDVVGDNLITEGIDLGRLEEGAVLYFGEVELVRTPKAHRPCATFRSRTSPEAFAAVAQECYRGALFNVHRGGSISQGDAIVVSSSSSRVSNGA